MVKRSSFLSIDHWYYSLHRHVLYLYYLCKSSIKKMKKKIARWMQQCDLHSQCIISGQTHLSKTNKKVVCFIFWDGKSIILGWRKWLEFITSIKMINFRVLNKKTWVPIKLQIKLNNFLYKIYLLSRSNVRALS